MGVVIRQGFKASVGAYIGIGIGLINQLFIAPKYLSAEQIGLQRTLLDASLQFAAVCHLGAPFIAERFFSYFKNNKEEEGGFFFVIFLYPIVGLGLLMVILELFKSPIASFYSKNAPQILDYYYWVIPLVLFTIYNQLLAIYCRINHTRIAVTTFIQEAILKFNNVILIVLFSIGFYSFDWLIYLSVFCYGINTILLIVYISTLGTWKMNLNFAVLKSERLKEMVQYGGVIILGGLGYGLMMSLDKVLLTGSHGGAASTGVYAIAMYMVIMIDMPKRAIVQISAPMVSAALQNNDMAYVRKVYHQSAINQFILGLLMFLVLWCNLDHIYHIMPNGAIYRGGTNVVLLIGMARLFEMASGFSDIIISYSKYYRYATYLLIFIGFVTIVAQSILIPMFEITGAALATLIVTVILIFSRVMIVKKQFGFWPYNLNTIKVILIALPFFVVVPSVAYRADTYCGAWANIFIKSIMIVGIYLFLILKFKISVEITQIIDNTAKIIKQKIALRR